MAKFQCTFDNQLKKSVIMEITITITTRKAETLTIIQQVFSIFFIIKIMRM